MNNELKLIAVIYAVLFLMGCSSDKIIADKNYKKQVLREGEVYDTVMTRHYSPYGYNLSYETDRFSMEDGKNTEKYIGADKDTYFSVEYLPGRTLKEITDIIEIQYGLISGGRYVIDGESAVVYERFENDIVNKIYVLEENDAVYVITMAYLAEGQEGYGTLMQEIINSMDFD